MGQGTDHPPTKWSDDAFLDEIRRQTDPMAEAVVRDLGAAGIRTPDITSVFRKMSHNGVPIPPGTPPRLREYLEATSELPPHTDPDRLDRGQSAFMMCTVPSMIVLLLKSLPEGYASPAFTRVLNLSGALREAPYHRFMGTLQLLMDVSSPHGFEKAPPPGHQRANGPPRGIVSTQQVRLLHAGVRVNVARHMDGYAEYVQAYGGEPINLEDMLGTLIGFSLLVVQGLRTLGVVLGPDDDSQVPDPDAPYTTEEEDYYYLWQTYGLMAGIHPAGEPHSTAYIPATLAEAEEFYDAFKRRHYCGATSFAPGWREQSWQANQGGVELADAHIRMLGDDVLSRLFFPVLRPPLKAIGFFRLIPRIYAHQLIGDVGCARVGIRPVTLFFLLKSLLFRFPRAWDRLWARTDATFHVWASEQFMEYLIHRGYEKGIYFTVPDSLQDLRDLVDTGWTPGSDQPGA